MRDVLEIWSFRQPAKRLLLHCACVSGVSGESPFLLKPWRAYYRSYLQVSKTREVRKFPHRLSSPSLWNSFSSSMSSLSSSSWKSKTGFIGWCLGKFESHPLVTKCITSSLTYAAADLTFQDDPYGCVWTNDFRIILAFLVYFCVKNPAKEGLS